MNTRLKGWPRTLWHGFLDVVKRCSSWKGSAGAVRQDSATWLRGWMVMLLLGGVAAYCIAEEITLTTYYPSPRGMYNELRTAGNVQIGSVDAPAVGPPVPRLHLVQGEAAPVLRVDDEAPVGSLLDATPFLIDQDGNVGLGTASPGAALDVNGALSMRGIAAPAVSPAGQGRIYFDSTANAFKVSENGGGYDPIGGGWITNGTSIYYDAGNVGIGTPAPELRLHVRGGAPWGSGIALDARDVAGGREWLLASVGGTAGQGQGNFVLYDQSGGGGNIFTIRPDRRVFLVLAINTVWLLTQRLCDYMRVPRLALSMRLVLAITTAQHSPRA